MEELQADFLEAKKELALQTYLKDIAEAETEGLKAQILKLNEEINCLKNRAHNYIETREIATQTCGGEHETQGTATPEVAKEDSLVAPDLLENGIDSLAETLRQTAKTAVEESGYVMDMESGMYYDYKSGYYYDPKTSLLYDPQTATYFYYNQDTNSYDFHSKLDLGELGQSENTQDDQKLAWEAKTKTKKKTSKKKKPKQLEDHIISSFSRLNINSSPLAVGSGRPSCVNPMDYPPCVRLIVTDSSCLAIGSLHIVTVMGGTIGREGSDHIVKLPEIAVSKQHAEISYCDQKKCYSLKDLGSRNGTLLNRKVIASGGTLAKALDLTHNDILKIGGTTFEVHIHLGNWTCQNCEPGLVQAKLTAELPQKVQFTSDTKVDKEMMRKKELKNMKKKYNLVGEQYRPHDVTADGKYTDRAEDRRQTIGSDNPYEREDVSASVDIAIDESNKGHQMLLKMGWKEGNSLGRGNKGLKEPIQVGIHSGKAGLGSISAMPLDMALNRSKKVSFSWNKVQERFQQADAFYKGNGADVNQTTGAKYKMWIQGATESLEQTLIHSANKESEVLTKERTESCAKVDMFGDE